MGKAIEAAALRKGHEIAGVVDHLGVDSIGQEVLEAADVAIEFTQPDAAVENISFLIQKGIPVVSGTTGWLANRATVDELVKKKGGAFIHSSNYSIGVNLFFRINELAAQIMQQYEEYEIELSETHHTEKKDSPSGTAIILADLLLKELKESKTKWVNEGPSAPEELFINSERIANVPGTHEVFYSSKIDAIHLRHIAHTREGFASGAVAAAEWLKDKKGSFSMRDMLGF